ncbi:MAG: poly-beta,6-N-acetyl-D-glucosamine synthase [Bacteroidales bacterium]|nr:poly-beta,6-N-acetyl-D-glucosamine synthase [Bacteroidales bacterium]
MNHLLTFLPLFLLIPYWGTIGLFYFGWLRLRKPEDPPEWPKVSILIAARNEAHHLPGLLHDLMKVDYPKECLEIIIADDHSSDETAKVASSFAGIKVIQPDGIQFSFEGKKEALKSVVKISTGEIILFTDADCRVKRGWVKAMVAPFAQPHIHMVAGPVTLDGNPLMELEFLSLAGCTGGSIGAGLPIMSNGASLAFRRDTWLHLSYSAFGNQLSSGDDVFMMMAVIKHKGNSSVAWCHAKEAIVNTPAPNTLGDFFMQRLRWAGKSGHYNYWPSKIVALMVFFTNLFFFLSILALMTGIAKPFFMIFLLKSIPDFLLLWEVSGFFSKRRLLWNFLPLQFLYPFYVTTVTVGTVFLKPQWKGRQVR